LAKHHTTPKFYIKGFCDPDVSSTQGPLVWVHHPGSGWIKGRPKSVSVQSGYYSLPHEAGKDPDELERFLSHVESVAAQIIRGKVMSKTPLTESERLELSLFIATMQARAPGQHEHVGEFVAEIGRHVLAVGVHEMKQDRRKWEAFKQWFESDTGESLPEEFGPEDLDPNGGRYRLATERAVSVALSFTNIEMVAQIIEAKGWRLLVSSPPNYFITSDYPFGIYDPATEGTIYGPTLASRTTQISIPLTRTIALVAQGQLKGTQWVSVTEGDVAAINARTAMRANLLIAPKTTFPGSDRIVTAAALSPQQASERKKNGV
jgi:hypothetical protein